MKFHGFNSVPDYITACQGQRSTYYDIRFAIYRRVRNSDFTVPDELRPLLVVPPYGDRKTDITIAPPETLVVVLTGHTVGTAVQSFNVFNADLSAFYADGIKEYYKPLLARWGYEAA